MRNMMDVLLSLEDEYIYGYRDHLGVQDKTREYYLYPRLSVYTYTEYISNTPPQS
jgi:hypothetical protein